MYIYAYIYCIFSSQSMRKLKIKHSIFTKNALTLSLVASLTLSLILANYLKYESYDAITHFSVLLQTS